MNIQKAWEGTSTATGVLPLIPRGLPAHLKPSAARLAPGSDPSGEQRVTAVNHVFVGDTPNMTLSGTFINTGSATLEVCNGDPAVAGNWVVAGTALAANGSVSYVGQHQFVRVSVTDLGIGGGLDAQLATSNT